MILVYFLFGGFLRRWYGGLWDEEQHKILGNRGLQTAAMLLAFFSIYFDPAKTGMDLFINLIQAVAISAWLQFQFWSRGHGACFDFGRDKEPTEETIRRYNERWYHHPCDFLFKNHKYGFLYDFLYMGLRYTGPMLPMAVFFDWEYIKLGAMIAPIYAFCWTTSEMEQWIKPKKKWLDAPTKWAEIICGGLIFAGCYYLEHLK